MTLYSPQLVPLSFMADGPPTFQLFDRDGDSLVGYTVGDEFGSPITGVVDGDSTFVWNFDVTSVAVGYYYGQIIGVSDPDALPFPVRKTSSGFYSASTFSELQTISEIPAVPSPISGLCNILFAITLNGVAVEDARVTATLEDRNNTTDGFLASRTIDEATTDESGYCYLTLIHFAAFTKGGVYRIRVFDGNKVLHDRRVTVPTLETMNAEDLPDA